MAAEKNTTTADPFEAFRKMRDTSLEGMSKVIPDVVNTEEYAQATGALLNNYLTLSAPFREALDKAMIMALEQFSLPSRQQVVASGGSALPILKCDSMIWMRSWTGSSSCLLLRRRRLRAYPITESRVRAENGRSRKPTNRKQ